MDSEIRVSVTPPEDDGTVAALRATIARQNDEILHLRKLVTEANERAAQLAHLASTDALTGLPNRRSAELEGDKVMARVRRGQNMALIYLDIDDFKKVNDLSPRAHADGDDVLIGVAEKMNHTFREVDTKARLGGEEFVVFLDLGNKPMTIEELESFTKPMLERFMKILAEIKRPDNGLPLTASIGTVILPGFSDLVGVDYHTIESMADGLMYEAKMGGKNRFRLKTFIPITEKVPKEKP